MIDLNFTWNLPANSDYCTIYQLTNAEYLELYKANNPIAKWTMKNGNPETGETLEFRATCSNSAGESEPHNVKFKTQKPTLEDKPASKTKFDSLNIPAPII